MSSNSAQIGEYARLLVERCLGVQPGWQVTVRSSPLARPLVEEVTRRIARRRAYALVRLSYGLERLPHDLVWAAQAPLELLRTMAPIFGSGSPAGRARSTTGTSISREARSSTGRSKTPPKA